MKYMYDDLCLHTVHLLLLHIWGCSKNMTYRQENKKKKEKMKTEDPLIGSTAGSPMGVVQYINFISL